jgi:hypothetical protein
LIYFGEARYTTPVTNSSVAMDTFYSTHFTEDIKIEFYIFFKNLRKFLLHSTVWRGSNTYLLECLRNVPHTHVEFIKNHFSENLVSHFQFREWLPTVPQKNISNCRHSENFTKVAFYSLLAYEFLLFLGCSLFLSVTEST